MLREYARDPAFSMPVRQLFQQPSRCIPTCHAVSWREKYDALGQRKVPSLKMREKIFVASLKYSDHF
jgi:hypothetical protein